jgi:hypothetical protein
MVEIVIMEKEEFSVRLRIYRKVRIIRSHMYIQDFC